MKLFFKFSIIFFIIALYFVNLFNSTLLIKKPQIYELKSGFGIYQISKDLDSLNLKILAKILGANFKAGYYELKPNMKITTLIDNFNKAKVALIKITLIEGKTVQNYYTQLSQNKALKNNKSLDDIMSKISVNEPYEGKFFPDTYIVNYGDSVLNIFKRANKIMQKKLDTLWQKRAENLPLKSPYEAIILASLIEKETAKNTEKTKISSVFINRLNKNMRLQTDPTVIYALGEKYQGFLTKKDLKINNLYNTYKNKGLPPGAISSVGISSLYAALNPDTSESLYFVSKKDGSHIFAKTYQQHLDNINKYLK